MLTFNLKKEWFEKIKSGEKTHEYREVKPYWTIRIANACKNELFKIAILDCGNDKTPFFMHADFENICFRYGYSNNSDKEKMLFAKIKTLALRTYGKNTDLKTNKPVFDIKFELIERGGSNEQ